MAAVRRPCSPILTILTIALILAAVAPTPTAGEPPSSDPTPFLERYAATYRFRLGRPTAIRLDANDRTALFLRSGPRDFVQDLYELELEQGTERRLLAAGERLEGSSETIDPEERARRERMRQAGRGIVAFKPTPDGRSILVPLAGRLLLVDRGSGSVRTLPIGDGPMLDPQMSPDGTAIAFVRDGELHLLELDDDRLTRLTSGAGAGRSHGLAEFVAQEEMGRHHGYWWSPRSDRLLVQRTDETAVEQLFIADAAHPDRAPDRRRYPRAGRPNATVELALVDRAGGERRRVTWDRERLEYLAAVRWRAHGPPLLVVQSRKQDELRLLAVDEESGATSTLIVERDAAWVDLEPQSPHLLPGGRFLWVAQRGGSRRLELREANGALARRLTDERFGLQALERVDESGREAIVRASADPTESHIWSIPLDGGRPRRLTRQPGVHTVVSRGGDRRFVVRSSDAEGNRSWRLFTAEGPADRRLTSRAELPGLRPRLEFVRTGRLQWHAVLVRPRSFVAGRRYPVIVHVYGGPTSQMVRKDGSRYLLDQWIADQGYVVVAIDGRGTPNRGRDWHRSVHLDLISVPLADQAEALGSLGQRYPELDLSRVGIYGWSFGGYVAAMAVLRRPDVFHAGFAGAPVIDWHDYDTHYTERYMDLPEANPAGYRVADARTGAETLQRALLLVHGTADDNVYLSHSLGLADRLLRAGRPFEFLPLPGQTHMVSEPEVARRIWSRMIDWFDDRLARPAGAIAPDSAAPREDP